MFDTVADDGGKEAPQQQEERPSTPTTATDLETTTDRSPPGEWKEVVSKKKKILRASTPKKESPAPPRRRTPPMERRRTPPLEQPRKIQRTTAPRTSPTAPAPAPTPVPASTPLPTQKSKQEEGECFLSGCGKSYPIHEKYDLDEVRTLRLVNGKQGTIIRAYRLPDEDGSTTEEAPVYFTCIEEQPIWYFLKGYSSKYFWKRFFDDIQEVHKGHSSQQQHALVRRPGKMLCRYRPLQEVSEAGTLAPGIPGSFQSP